MVILFVHGWGFDVSIWHAVSKSLPSTLTMKFINLGFIGEQTLSLPASDRIVCVGHSLGVMWLLKHVKNPIGFVAINGFDCFYNHISVPDINAMKTNIDRNALAQMRGFYNACGVPHTTLPNFNKTALKQGLTWLETWNVHDELSQLSCPITALSSKNDAIISARASEAIWSNHELIWHDDGGHCLPITASDLCAQKIKDLIHACAA